MYNRYVSYLSSRHRIYVPVDDTTCANPVNQEVCGCFRVFHRIPRYQCTTVPYICENIVDALPRQNGIFDANNI